MLEYIAASDVANQVSMLRSVFHGPVLIVEGVTDKRLFGKFMDQDGTEVIVAHSKDNVRLAVRELYMKRNDSKTIGIMDADMDRLNGKEPKRPLFLTDERDLEMMMIRSEALDDVVWEYGDEPKVESFVERNGQIRDVVVNASYPLGLMMFVSQSNDLGLCFKDLDFTRFVDTELRTNIRNMIDEILYVSKNQGNSKRIRSLLEAEIENERDPWIVCRGHDAVEVLAIGLRKVFGSYNSRSIRTGELSGSLRLAYAFDQFKETQLFRDIGEWCSDHDMVIFTE